ncbi:SusC/RagA family TonB-linked outer membrane protein [Segatella maculosa]|uniref:SusC/RagA family TonB-linked outer membrane protein n=1 Tax=Segatella maculosa TaxID=439703 RepID=UPI0003775975|nr:SusC/RagA family TonB-linked outer membrane protein [Segatella maculosa]
MKKHLYLFLTLFSLFLLWGNGVQAQTQTPHVSGSVLDTENNPIIGASVMVKGTKEGTISNTEGNFSIKAAPGSVLVVSYIGFATQEVKVTGRGKPIIITMREDTKRLNEVVVTALGIKRERKALGYSLSEIDGKELQKAKETNVINSLAGKVAGLSISQTATGPAGSTRVILRGSTELTGNNQPLYVIDGVPMDNTNYDSSDQWGGFDLGDGISSINPDDIENISVLKGPAASALYGSRASHGVILITTKKASTKKDFSIELNSTATIETQLTKWSDVQYEFGQGSDGRITLSDDRYSSNRNWGPRVDPGLYLTYFDGVARPLLVVKDNIDGFFRTGVNTTNSLIIDKMVRKTGLRVTYTDMRDKDLIPKTHMSRNTLNLRANTNITKYVDLDFKVTYTHENVHNRPAVADHRANIAKNLMTLSTTFDQAWLRDNYQDANGEYYNWNDGDRYNINPYWVLNKMSNDTKKDTYRGSAVIRYRPFKQMSLRATLGTDMNFLVFEDFAYPTSPGREMGALTIKDYRNRTYTAEFLASYRDRFKKLNYGATVGGNIYKVDNKTRIIMAQNMVMRDAKALESFSERKIEEEPYCKQINSVYGSLNLGYDNFAYMDMTLRGDYSSTLPIQNNLYWYPSVSGSFLFSEFFHINKEILPYGKVRASWAKVGHDTWPYLLQLMYEMAPHNFGKYPMASITNDVIPNKKLKPTMTNSVELGFELKFLNNRIGLDVTYYNQHSRDQILRMNTAHGSGYRFKMVNAGDIENRGIEIVLNTRPIDLQDFSWDLNMNFAKNKNKVRKLANGVDEFELSSARWLGVKIVAKVGENYGCIMGQDFLRNANGDVIIDGKTGLPKITDDLKVLGNATWDWTGGLTTNFRYKNLTLGAIFDVKVGADLYSMSARSAYYTGKNKETLEGRDGWYASEEQRLQAGVAPKDWKPTGGYIAKGVIEQPDGTYKPNDIYVNPQDYWMHVAMNTARPFIYDNSYVKLRELTLSYAFPKRMLGKVIQSLSVSFVARNLFNIYKNIPNIDPDSNYNNGPSLGLEYGSLPSRRSIGMNVNLKF